MYLLHLSDLHVCEENKRNFLSICDSIIEALNNYPGGAVYPEVLLITGDYTNSGTFEDLSEVFSTFFDKKLKTSPVFANIEYTILVPGNHDYPWGKSEVKRTRPFETLVKLYMRGSSINNEFLQKRMEDHFMQHAYKEFGTYRVLIIGMNSMKIDSEERPGIGYFDKDQLLLVKDVVNYYRNSNANPLYTFVAFHHHILPVSFVERDTLDNKHKYSLTLDARRAIDTFLECGVQFALHGHQHQPSMLTVSDDLGKHANQCLHVLSSGCLTDANGFNDSGRRSFLLYEIEENTVKVRLAETAREDADKFNWDQPVTYYLNEFSRPHIDKKRIRDWAEKDNKWVNQAEEANSFSSDDEAGNVSITELVDMLVDGIHDDGSVAYYAGKKERYRTSTLATVLECVSEIDLFPQEDILVMQKKLMRLRDDEQEVIRINDTDDVIQKSPEDAPAWGIDEAPSVWTTSKALSALFLTKYVPQNKEEEQKLRDSVLWLANQQYKSGGWGYQNYGDSSACHSSIPMTALALHALCLSLSFEYIRADNETNLNRIYNAIKKGAYRLIEKMEPETDKKYWTYDGKPNLSASIWSLQALEKAGLVLRSYAGLRFERAGKEIEEKLRKIKRSVIDYVIDSLPSTDDAQSITEAFFIVPLGGSLKYKPSIKKRKEFRSFTPYVLSYLLKADGTYVDKPKVKSMIKWVLTHKDTKWLIDGFNGELGDPCMISIAMSICIIVRWLQEASNRAVEDAIKSLETV